jgi:uracil-DNA glycosylase
VEGEYMNRENEKTIIRMDNTWNTMLGDEWQEEYFKHLWEKLEKDKQSHKGKVRVPEDDKIFRAFDLCTVESLKVVIVGQDPYPNKNNANGLAFSVSPESKLPPSLRNIFKVVKDDLQLTEAPVNGDLERWATQGVLLLNRVLTTREGSRNAHKGIGWESFTENVIKRISEEHSNIVFMLWGNKAKQMKKLINEKNHLILESSHPSPLSARLGFLTCEHFKRANEYIKRHKKKPIDWR